jgi:hypothetical protein
MPWTIKDVEKHNKGLSDKQKAQWVKVANSALQSCVEKGGSEETCAASAIRQANGVVANMENIIHINVKAENYKLSKRKLEGKDYLVFPVTMMVEGVHNGSQGPILHPIDELGKIPAAWNGIPIVVNHPEENGVPISANIPEVLEASAVGKVFSTYVDGSKLKAKAWLEEVKAANICPDVLEDLKKGDPIEVSVGVFSDYEEVEGDWNGESYSKVAINHRPDHLALLPNSVGACSLADGCGCGFSVNVSLKGKDLLLALQKYTKEGFRVSQIGDNAEAGYRERIEAVYNALKSMDKEGAYNYLEEMYDDNLVFSRSTKDGTKMYKQDYKFESGKIELVGNPVEVRRQVEYIVNQIVRTKFKNKEVKMAEECTPCIKKKVDELIANSQGRWTEGDREFLQTLDEAKLDKLVPQIVEKEKIVEKEVQVNALTDAQKAALAFGEKQLKERREQMVTEIQANTSKEIWPDTILANMDEDTLSRVFNSVKKAKEEIVDYSLSGGGATLQDNKGIPPMLPGGMEDEPKK